MRPVAGMGRTNGGCVQMSHQLMAVPNETLIAAVLEERLGILRTSVDKPRYEEDSEDLVP